MRWRTIRTRDDIDHAREARRKADRIVLRNIVLTILVTTGSAVVIATSCLGRDRSALRDDGSASGITETVAGAPSPAPPVQPQEPSTQSSAGGAPRQVSTTTITQAQLERAPAPAAPPAPPAPTINVEVRPTVSAPPATQREAPQRPPPVPAPTQTATPQATDAGEPAPAMPNEGDAGATTEAAEAGAPRVIITPWLVPIPFGAR